MDNEKIKELKVAKQKCLMSFGFFCRYFFFQQHQKKFIVSDHHSKIIHALERVTRGECKRLIINLPPRFGKTEIAVKMWIAWCMALNSQSKFIHLSYSDSLALDNSEEVKDIITSAEYQQMFPNVRVKKDSKAKDKWYTDNGGGVLARSSSGQVTGFGAGSVDEPTDEIEFLSGIELLQKFAGAIIIDDPIKPDDAHSETLREKVNTKFESTIRSRVNSRNTPIVIIMQRLHEEDLAGYLLNVEPQEWEILKMPAINDDGTALWPHKMNLDELKKVENANKYVFETQYMQNPYSPIGRPFHETKLKWVDKAELLTILANAESCISFVDCKDEGKDFYAHPVGVVVGDTLYIVDAVYNDNNSDITIPKSVNVIKQYNCQHTVVETNGMGTMFFKRLKSEVDGRVFPMNNKAHKGTRIANAESFIVSRMVFIKDHDNEEYRNYVRALIKFEYEQTGKPDDAPDATAGLATLAMVKFPHIFNR